MAAPKVFVSSTYYDLRHIRSNLELFISELGYDAVLFENGSVLFDPSNPLDESCYDEVRACDIFVLIIGGRYGAIASSESQRSEKADAAAAEALNSVTKKEYVTAREKDLPIYIFVEKAVAAEYRTFQKNRKNKKVKYAHVDNVGVFNLLDDIYQATRNNLVREFEKAADIEGWLRDQWAGLFAQLMRARTAQKELQDLSAQMSELSAITDGLKNYSELMLKALKVANADKVISDTGKKIDQAKVDDFIVSPMMIYLVRRARKAKVPIDVRRWTQEFRKAVDARTFLEAIGFEGPVLDGVWAEVGNVMDRDFHRYRLRYFGVPLPDLEAEVGSLSQEDSAPRSAVLAGGGRAQPGKSSASGDLVKSPRKSTTTIGTTSGMPPRASKSRASERRLAGGKGSSARAAKAVKRVSAPGKSRKTK